MKIYRVEIVEPLSEEGDSYEFQIRKRLLKNGSNLEKNTLCV